MNRSVFILFVLFVSCQNEHSVKSKSYCYEVFFRDNQVPSEIIYSDIVWNNDSSFSIVDSSYYLIGNSNEVYMSEYYKGQKGLLYKIVSFNDSIFIEPFLSLNDSKSPIKSGLFDSAEEISSYFKRDTTISFNGENVVLKKYYMFDDSFDGCSYELFLDSDYVVFMERYVSCYGKRTLKIRASCN